MPTSPTGYSNHISLLTSVSQATIRVLMASDCHSLPLGFSSMKATRPFICLVLVLITVALASHDRSSLGAGTFEFHIHHRFSDTVKGILPQDGLPEEGTIPYYAAMAQRDQTIRGRRLSASKGSSLLTFRGGTETFRIPYLGFLHYVKISVGTPPLEFLVALDTGSDLFWLPCHCMQCARVVQTLSGKAIELNQYSPSTSSSSSLVSCSDPLCTSKAICDSLDNGCPYEVQYVSESTASYGYLVHDGLHLVKADAQGTALTANITFGCGTTQTGVFLKAGAPNGLLGLGMSKISVPSTLARDGYILDSFSMCFGLGGIGTITFGDQGSLDQAETPFLLNQTHYETYYVSITQVSVGEIMVNLSFTAIFDSGTSFTYLNDPVYSTITETYSALIRDNRFKSSSSNLPFEYCYKHEGLEVEPLVYSLTLEMNGGGIFNVTNPFVLLELTGGLKVYCLAIIKSDSIDLIGQNFMDGYRIVFSRERNVLGWKAGNCSEILKTSGNAPSTNQATPGAKNRNATASSSSTRNAHQSSPMVRAWLLGWLGFVVFYL